MVIVIIICQINKGYTYMDTTDVEEVEHVSRYPLL